MSVWFAIIWVFAVIRVVFSPFFLVGKKMFSGVFIVFLLWVGIGIGVHAFRRQEFAQKHTNATINRQSLETQKTALLQLEKDHPTARDVLLHLASLSYQLGDTPSFENYLRRAQQIDPNNQLVGLLSSFTNNK